MTREIGDTRVLARVQAPGYPAHVFAHRNGRVYAATYNDPSGSDRPSVVREWTRDGTLLRDWKVPGQALDEPHGAQVATADAAGRLIVLDKGTGRVLTLDLRTGRWATYARTRSVEGGHPIPNYAAWGPDGSLYVTDYGQPVLWRVPPGGGRAQVWLTDRRLDGGDFGTTGLQLAPDRRALFVMQQSSLGLGEPTVVQGKLYRVPLARPALEKVWTSRALELPDGFAFGRSGKVYVALLGTNQLAVLDEDFRVERRIGAAVSGANGSPIPFDTPSNATFAGRSVLVANQSALLQTTANHAILDVHVGEPGHPVFIPRGAGR